MTYQTKQKETIEEIIKHINKEFTIKDIYELLEGKVGLTTLYRYIDKLVESDRVKKISDSTYQYLEECNEENHFYLKCIKCSTLTHIDCDCIKELSNHMFKEHGFIPDNKNIIITGICKTCKGDN